MSGRLAPTANRKKRREMGGAPGNAAPRNHFLVWTPGNHLLVWIVKPSGCHCTDASGGKHSIACRPLLGALPLSLDQSTTH